MTVVIDAGIASPTANAYCDVTYADAYWSARLYADVWTAATADQKAVAMMNATRLLDELPWKGQRTTIPQSLRWPRVGMFDRDGIYVLNLQIPTVLKDCTAELAGLMLKEDRTDDVGAIGVSMIKLASLQINMSPGRIHRTIPDTIYDKLRHWLSGFGSKVVRC